jgi:hypothetical protein
MSLPTASEVTNLYLYGTKITPNNLVDDAQIRPKLLPDPTSENLSAVEFMSTGAGRFALASMSSLVEMFFLHLGDIPGVVPGNAYTKAQMASIFGLDEYAINVQQYSYDDGQGDYGEVSTLNSKVNI